MKPKCQIPGCKNESGTVVVARDDNSDRLLVCSECFLRVNGDHNRGLPICDILNCKNKSSHKCLIRDGVERLLCENHYEVWLEEPRELPKLEGEVE
jgi:hypothetical protein